MLIPSYLHQKVHVSAVNNDELDANDERKLKETREEAKSEGHDTYKHRGNEE